MTELDKTNQSRKEEPDLYKRSIKGGFWVFALKLTTQGLGIAKSIIVANCLMLDNLGLIGVAALLIEILNTFSESGVNAALVQKKDDISDYLNTAWVISIIRGILLFLALYLTAPLFASIKVRQEDIPLAISVMRIMGLCLLIQGFRNIGVVYFQKNLEFHKTFWMSLAGILTDSILSITLMLIYRNVWSVIIARLISACVNFIMSYMMCPYRPKFHFVPSKAKELWKFGKWIFGGRIVSFILTQGDDFFVWFYLGLPDFALYRYAYRFALMPTTHITYTISTVSFPAFSRIQNDLPRLKEAYLKVLKFTALFSVPASFMIFFMGPDFVHLFLEEHLHPMAIILQILAVKGLLKSLNATRGALLKSLDKLKARLHLQWLRLVILGILIYPLTKMWGIAGTALATVLLNVIVSPLGMLVAKRLLKCTLFDLVKPSLVPLGASIGMTLGIWAMKSLVFTENTYLSFIALCTFATTIYIGIVWAIDFSLDRSYNAIIKEQLSPVLNKINRQKDNSA